MAEDSAGKDSLPQLTKDQYLARLPDIDRGNLEKIIQLFDETTQQMGRKVSLVAVGGTLTKPLPRKDIDLLVIFDQNDSDPERQDYPDYHQYSLADFQILRQLVSKIVEKDSRFKIEEVLEPAIDEEFGSPSILKHDGSITVADINNRGAAAILEFIRITDRGTTPEVMLKQLGPQQTPRPYLVLT